jgi:hypothetical protein
MEHKPTEEDLNVRQGMFVKPDGARTNFGFKNNWDYMNAIPLIMGGSTISSPVVAGGVKHELKRQAAKEIPSKTVQAAKAVPGKTVQQANRVYTHPEKSMFSPEAQVAIEKGELVPDMIKGKKPFEEEKEWLYPGVPHVFSDEREILMHDIAKDVASRKMKSPAYDKKFDPFYVQYERQPEWMTSASGFTPSKRNITDYEEVKRGIRPPEHIKKLLKLKKTKSFGSVKRLVPRYSTTDATYGGKAFEEWQELYKTDKAKALEILGQKFHGVLTNTTDVGYQSAFPHWYNVRKTLNYPRMISDTGALWQDRLTATGRTTAAVSPFVYFLYKYLTDRKADQEQPKDLSTILTE